VSGEKGLQPLPRVGIVGLPKNGHAVVCGGRLQRHVATAVFAHNGGWLDFFSAEWASPRLYSMVAGLEGRHEPNHQKPYRAKKDATKKPPEP
jgi:hypothetical protein